MPAIPTKSLVRQRVQPIQSADLARTRSVRLIGGVTYDAGTVLGEVQVAAADEVQTITLGGTPSGGTFRLLFPAASAGGYDATDPITWSGTGATLAANIQAALDDLFGEDQIVVTGTGPFTLTYSGDLFTDRDVPAPNYINSLTGTSPTITIATTTAGSIGLVGQYAAYDDSASDGRQVAKGILVANVRTAPDGTVVDEFGKTGQLTVEMWDRGDFLCSDLTGLDANGVTDLGKLISGSAYSVSGAIVRIG